MFNEGFPEFDTQNDASAAVLAEGDGCFEEPGSLALAACACMLLAAFTNCSLIGAVFLAAFGVWGCICAIDTRRDENRVVTSTQIPRSSLRGKVSTSLWSFVASLASIVLVAQVALQTAYKVAQMSWAETHNARLVLQLLGFPRIRNNWEFLLAFFPSFLCLVSAILEANSARQRRRGGDGMRSSHPALHRMDGPLRATYALAWAAGYTSAGVLAGLTAAVAPLSHPALPGLPLLAGTLACVWRWGRRQHGSLPSGLLLSGQLWTGLWVAALYLWQIALLRPHFFNRAATWGGLYVISSSAPAATTVFQLIHLTSLVVLFGALSCYGRSTGGRVSTREFSRHMRPQRTAAGQRSRSERQQQWALGSPCLSEEGLWWGGPLQVPSQTPEARALQSLEEQQDGISSDEFERPTQHSDYEESSHDYYSEEDEGYLSYRATQWACMVIETGAAAAVQVTEAILSRPAVPAATLVAFALLAPSIAAAGAAIMRQASISADVAGKKSPCCRHVLIAFAVVLVAGLWVLLVPAALGERPLVATAPVLAATLMLWLLSVFLAAAVAPLVSLSPLLQSLGLYCGSDTTPAQPFWALPGLLIVAVAFVGLSRSRMDLPHASRYGVCSDEEAAVASFTEATRHWDRLQAAILLLVSSSSGAPPGASSAAHLHRHNSLEGFVDQPLLDGDDGPQDSSGEHDVALAAVLLGLGRSGWLAGWLLVPVAVFWAGTCRWDFGHLVYLLLLLLRFLRHTLRLQPQVSLAILSSARYLLLCSYGGVHLVAMYLAAAAALPGVELDSYAAARWPAVNLEAKLNLAGLWRPSPWIAMFPVLVAVLVASVHSRLGCWLEDVDRSARDTAAAAAGRPAASFSASAIPQPLQWVGRGAITLGSLCVVVLGYLLLLWVTQIGLVGLGILLLLAALFVVPPLPGRYLLRDKQSGLYCDFTSAHAEEVLHQQRLHFGITKRVIMLGSGSSRWGIAAAVAAYSAIDAVAHYAFAATSLLSLLNLPLEQIQFLQEVVGIGIDTVNPPLALQLGRSFSLLAALAVYRFLFAVGTLSEQRQLSTATPAEEAARQLQKQTRLSAFLKRAVVLHGGKLIALVAWWLAVQRPGAIGWVYTVGLVGCAPLLGGASSRRPFLRAAFSVVLAATDILTIAWILAQYSFQVIWLRHFLGHEVVEWLIWGGLRMADSPGASLERLLRLKFLLLFVVTLKRRSSRWLEELPEEVREAGGPAADCALFWPDAATGAVAASSSAPGSDLLTRLRTSAFVSTLRLAMQALSQRVQASATKVLTAVDWPPTEPPATGDVAKSSSTTDGSSNHAVADRNSDIVGANDNSGTDVLGDKAKTAAAVKQHSSRIQRSSAEIRSEDGSSISWAAQLGVFRFAAQDWAESLWQNWGMEVCMAALLTAAFLFLNAMSLLFLAAVGIGMAASENVRRYSWRFLVLPLLGLLLLEQYSLLVGLPPGIHWSVLARLHSILSQTDYEQIDPSVGTRGAESFLGGSVAHRHSAAHDFRAWAGLEHVNKLALWALFLAWATSVIQVHWAACNPVHDQRRAPNDMLPGLREVASGGTREPLITRTPSSDTAEASAAEEGRTRYNADEASCDSRSKMWAPLTYEAMPTWRWVDWSRYLFYRHYPDCVLIAVVALCTLENDVIHAGYLALAMLFFRRREALRRQTNRMFRWLPVYNFAVMAATLLYQAPFERFLGPWAHNLDSKVCSLAHVAGLYKMGGDIKGRASVLSARGAVADMALWAIARVLTRVFASRSYKQAMEVLRAEATADAQAVATEKAAVRQRQENAVVAASRLRRTRAHRVRRLKAGVARREGNVYNVDPLLLDFASDEEDHLPGMTAVGNGSSLEAEGSNGNSTDGAVGPKGGQSSQDLVKQEAKLRGRYPSQTNLERGMEEVSSAAVDAVVNTFGSTMERSQSHKNQEHDGKLYHQLFALLDRSWTVYICFLAVFLCDMSVLTLVFLVTIISYALLSQSPKRTYWLMMLVYTEIVLIAQYVWQIPTRLNCAWVSPLLREKMEQIGLHGDALRCIPLFIAYLSVLIHTYSMSPVEEVSAEALSNCANMVSHLSQEGTGRTPMRSNHRAEEVDWVHRVIDSTAAGGLAIFEFYARITSSSERPLFFVLLDIGEHADGRSWEGAEGHRALQQHVQHVVDSYRSIDLAAARLRRKARAAEVLPTMSVPHSGNTNGSAGGDGLIDLPADNKASRRHVDLAEVGPLRVTVCRVCQRPKGGASAVLEVFALRSTASNTGGYSPVAGWPLRSLRPAQHVSETLLRLRADTELRAAERTPDLQLQRQQSNPIAATPRRRDRDDDTAGGTHSSPEARPHKHVSPSRRRPTPDPRLHPPQPIQWQAMDDGPTRRGPKPHQAQQLSPMAGGTSSRSGGRSMQRASDSVALPLEPPIVQADIKVEAVEHHAHVEADWYMLTVTADFLAFVYAALFYQTVLQSARSLADLTVQQVIPANYLLTLMALFLAIVLDRVCYTIGHHLGKAVLLTVQLVAVLWYAMALFWSPGQTSDAARMHLRIFTALKSLSFVFSALQLRSGYPPPASYQGGRGRHSYVFTRSTGMTSWLGFQLFAAVPFLYELREILDWSSTATTLRLFDWIKLQDIGMSLYFVTYNRLGRANRSLGQRIPRYQKITQGAVMFVGLLILLWVPLLVFSTGNPTFQTPGIEAFVANATITGGTNLLASQRELQSTFPLWKGGGQRVVGEALINGTLPPALVGQWIPDQFRLMCLAEDSDDTWLATPPFKQALSNALLARGASLEVGWEIARTAPPPSPHGGPLCDGIHKVPLAGLSRTHLLEILNGTRRSAQLMALNTSNPHGQEADAAGSPALYGLLWRFSGDACSVTPDVASLAHGTSDSGWGSLHVACNISLHPVARHPTSTHTVASHPVATHPVAPASEGHPWWRLTCDVVNKDGSLPDTGKTKLHDCPRLTKGPRLVAIMERVQAGLLGQTVSAFGITGLYITFVLSAGRFLRLAVGNMRMRIPYDDLPNTSRLIALCQDIAIARAEGEHALEEELYWAIINIYRRPSVLYEMTKAKQL